MFPTISHIIAYFTGLNIPLPFNTFGFFMASSFAVAYWVFILELKRKESQNLISPRVVKSIVGEAPKFSDFVLDAFFGFILGYKFVGAILNYQEFMANTELYVLSKQGSLFGGIALASLFVYMSYNDKKKQQLPSPKEIETLVHPFQEAWTILIYATVGGLFGAKLFHNLEYWNDFIQHPMEAMLAFSGLTFYGGLIGGGIGVAYFTKKKMQMPLLQTIDAFSPVMMIAYAVGRIGCHLSGDGDWGIVSNLTNKPTFFPDWLWSFNYPQNVINEGVFIPNCTDRFCHVLPQGVYPTALYEVIVCLLLFGLIWWLRKKITTAGVLACVYLILAGTERFFIEKIRVNSLYQTFGLQFTQAELISTIMIILGIAGTIILFKKQKQ